MTALRQEALTLVSAMPEIGLATLVQYIRDYQENYTQKCAYTEQDPFLAALNDNSLVTCTGIDVEEYMKELRGNDRL